MVDFFKKNYTLHIRVAELLIVLFNTFGQNDNKQGLRQGAAIGASAPFTRRKGPPNLRARVKVNLTMQKKVDFNNLIFQNFWENVPPDPPRHSCFQCSHPPKQNPAYDPDKM